MKLGWYVGIQDWAFKNLVEHLVVEMKDFDHIFNRSGNVNVLLSPEQLYFIESLDNVILHLDGNRWME